jgi:VCBS repeat-containing protein
LSSRVRSPRPGTRRRDRRLALEYLEDRTAPATFIVNSTQDTVDVNPGDGLALDSTGKTSLRAAIMEANALAGADTIQVPAGTFNLTIPGTYEDAAATGDLDVTDTLTIIGAGRTSTVINGGGLDRVFQVLRTNFQNPAPSLTLSALTITGGRSPDFGPASPSPTPDGGGGVFNSFAVLTLDDVVVSNNTTGFGHFGGSGGGVSTQSGQTTILNSLITGNTSSRGDVHGGQGGGVASSSSTTVIRNSVITSNRTGDGPLFQNAAGGGGGVYSEQGTLTISDSTISNNTTGTNTSSVGGGIDGRDTFTIDRTVISGNTAFNGGGISVDNGTLQRLADSVIAGNTSTGGEGGGGIHNEVGKIDLISGTTISGNRSLRSAGASLGGDGAGLFSQGHIGTIINSTISGNTAAGTGAGIHNEDNLDHLVNTTIANNTATDGGGLFHMLFVNFTPVIGELRNDLIADNTATGTANEDFVQLGVVTGAFNNLIETASGHSLVNGTNGNLVGLDPKLGPLADNGGPTMTQALLAGSPAIDAGSATGAPATDQRGLPRPSGAGVDIGGFEVQVSSNHPPVANNQSVTTNEDTSVSGTVTATDADNDPLTFAVVTSPAHGTLTFNGTTGAFTYKPALNYNGPDSFTFKANDGQADSNVATVSITVTPVNDPPFPSPPVQNVSTPEDTPLSGQVHGVDPDGDPLTFSLVQGPTHGTLTFNADGTYTYTPALNYNGSDAFVFRVSDPSGASNLGGVSITVTPVNDPPVAVNDAYSVDEGAALVISAAPVTRLRMVSDPGDFIGQGLTYDFNPATATFSGHRNFDNGASLSVDPPPAGEFWFLDFAAADQAPLTPGVYLQAMRFPFQDPGHPGLDVSGNGRGSNTLTGQFTVYDVGFNGDALTNFAAAFEQHSEGAAPALVGWVMLNTTFGAGGGVLANDTDPEGDLLLSATLVSGPAHGTLSFRGDGTFTYTPNPEFTGTDSFTYRTSDGRLDSNVATVTITVNPVNTPPTAADQSTTTDEDTPLAGTVTATDPDGEPLSYSVVTGPAHGTLTFNGTTGAFTYTPSANYNGPDSFTFKANDGEMDSNVATVSITVTPVNDPPVATGASVTTPEDQAVSGTLTASDVDGDTLHFLLVSGPAHGALQLTGTTGAFTYTPSANYNGPDSFTFKANDGQADSNVATVSITVTPVNDPPVAHDDSYTVQAGDVLHVAAPGVLANDTDVDGDTLQAALVSGPAHGALTLNADGSFLYTPAAGFSGNDSFTYRASDGILGDQATVTIQVSPAPATPGKVTGAGRLDRGARSFNINVRSQETDDGLAFTGHLSYVDWARGIHLESTSITYLRVEEDGIRATIRGTATVNGVRGYTFTVFVEDHGEPGRNDKFRIVITGPGGFAYDSADFAVLGGLLDSGNIQVHKR